LERLEGVFVLLIFVIFFELFIDFIPV